MNNFNFKLAIGIGVLAFVLKSGTAQTAHFEPLKVLKSQKEVEITALGQDANGFIWMGSNFGVARYDGVDFTWFTSEQGLQKSSVVSLAVNNDGTIWAGHKSGKISIISENGCQSFEPEEGTGVKPVSVIYFDTDNQLWYGTFGEGVYYFTGQNRQRLYNLNSDDGLLDDYVYSIVQDTTGLVYIATDKGISVYNSNTREFVNQITMANGLPDNIVTHLSFVNGKLWISMEDGGICEFNTISKQFINLPDWEFGEVSSFAFKNNDELWVNTKRNGIVKCLFDASGGVWYKPFNVQNGLWDNRGSALLCDYEGNLWIGSRKGLTLKRNIGIDFYDAHDNLSLSNVFSITQDKNGTYWLATEKGLLLLSTDKMGHLSLNPCPVLDRMQGVSFISVYTDAQGFIWAGTYGSGAFVIDPQTFKYKQFDAKCGLINPNVINITGTDSIIWLSTLGGGVFMVNKVTMCIEKTFSVDQGLPSNYIYSVFPISNQSFWVATDGGGAVKITGNTIVPLSHPLLDSIGKVVYSIIADSTRGVWLNLADNGIVYINDTNLVRYTVNNGLLSNSIQGMILNNNQLIVTSNQGFSIINTFNGTVVNKSEEYGLAYLEPNLNALYLQPNGLVLVGLANGMVSLSAPKNTEAQIPELLITRKSIYFNKIDNGITTFKHNQNHISFNYTANWFSMPGNITYRHKLEGYDLDWSAETNTRVITYSNLPSGNFVFKVEVKMPDGTWLGAEKATFAFKIKPPFYKTTWFILLAIMLGALSVISFIRYRTAKLIRDKDLLEQEVKKRTAEISKQKEEIMAQRDEIEAQRNYVMDQRDQIEQQNKDITASIQYASRIQNAMLLPRESLEQYLGEHFVFFRPRDIVSGDFYYVSTAHQKVIVAAADCTGHGVPGALMSMLGISLLNQIRNSLEPTFNAAHILNQLRSELKNSLRQTGKRDEAKDGMDISLCVIDKLNMKLHYAGAFNPLLMVRNMEPNIIKADKMPIGVYVTDEQFFTNNQVDLLSGDSFYLYSDGFQDQFGGPDKRKYLAKNFRQLLIDNSFKTMEGQYKTIESEFNNWTNQVHQIDDVLVFGIKI